MTAGVSRLRELEDGQLVEAFCPKSHSLGWYEIQNMGDGVVHLYDTTRARTRIAADRVRGPSGRRRPGVRGPRTGARRVIIEHYRGAPKVRWSCGCGAKPVHRTDRIGQLEATWTNGRFTVVL